MIKDYSSQQSHLYWCVILSLLILEKIKTGNIFAVIVSRISISAPGLVHSTVDIMIPGSRPAMAKKLYLLRTPKTMRQRYKRNKGGDERQKISSTKAFSDTATIATIKSSFAACEHTQNVPVVSLVTRDGMIVWYGRLLGAMTLGWAGSSENPQPRFCRGTGYTHTHHASTRIRTVQCLVLTSPRHWATFSNWWEDRKAPRDW